MRREQRVRCVEQRRAGRGLLLEHVDPGPAQVAGRERLGDGRLIDHPAPGDVEHDRTRLELGDRIAPDEPARRARQRDVDRHDVGPREQRLEIDQLHAVVGRLLHADEGIDAQDDHLHRPSAHGDRLADLAEPDDAEGPTAQLEPGELGPLPLAPSDGGIGRGGPAGDAIEQRERVLGRGDGVARRGVDDRDPGARRGVEVHVIDPDSGSPDDDEAGPGGDQLGIDLDLAADDERVVVGQDRGQLVAGTADPLIDLVVGREELDALAGDRFGDQHPHALAPATGSAAMP